MELNIGSSGGNGALGMAEAKRHRWIGTIPIVFIIIISIPRVGSGLGVNPSKSEAIELKIASV